MAGLLILLLAMYSCHVFNNPLNPEITKLPVAQVKIRMYSTAYWSNMPSITHSLRNG
jgi:hypothetical protein